ncbi:MAG: hypothetical protein KOO60_07110 [Gemmatimonadales bacterium]|nr:hypothetical protein [Gemmatimonadales bacterium]
MTSRFYFSAFLVLALLIPVSAFTIPDLDNTTVETRAIADVSILICPACDGRRLELAPLFGGPSVDATIELYLLDGDGTPVANFPFEDMWLDSDDLCFCQGGSTADANTDVNGYAQFQKPFCGGGCSENPSLGGVVNGMAVGDYPIPHIKVNSPDMNCDFIVDLVDVTLFASAYWAGYDYCADFIWDGVLNLSDVGILAQHYGHQCQ